MFHEIRGLPAHPLFVHFPVVLGPVVGLMCLALLVPSWRPRLLKWTAAAGVLFAVATIITAEAGEDLARTLGLGGAINEHQDAAETLRLLAIILAVVLVAALVVWSRISSTLQTVTAVAIAVLGLATVGYTVKTAEAGAKLVWKSQFDAANARDGN